MGLVKYSNAKKIIKMPECFTIYQVKDLQEELLSFEPEGDFIALDFSETKEIDAAGIQLLIAYNQHLLTKNHMLTCTGFSEDLFYLLNLYNPPFPINFGAAS